jgi:hypothetical protein
MIGERPISVTRNAAGAVRVDDCGSNGAGWPDAAVWLGGMALMAWLAYLRWASR